MIIIIMIIMIITIINIVAGESKRLAGRPKDWASRVWTNHK